MPPKDSIRLGPGQMYFSTPEGLLPLGEIQEVEITEESELNIDGTMPVRIVKEPAEITGTITLTDEAAEAWRKLTATVDAAARVFNQMMALYKDMVDTCPNRRVIHLIKHGSPRVRKKNFKRLVRYYKQRKD